MEKNNINKKKGKCPNPCFLYHSSQPHILYYNKLFSIHILDKKHADFFFFFFYLKCFSKKYYLKHGKQDIPQTTYFYKGCNCLYIYDTERLHCGMQKSLSY